MSRKRIHGGEARLYLLLTEELKLAITAAAERDGVRRSTWVREVLRREAERSARWEDAEK